MRTYVYVDGFNLYYRLLRETPRWKWLNLKHLSESILRPVNQVQVIRYYTARVSARADLHAPARQQVYLDALATVPEITVHMGNFLVSKTWAALVHPLQMRGGTIPAFEPPLPKTVRVYKTEEKGSDVNLASHLIRDAFRGDFDVAAVLSNDTDLVEPIRIVTKEVGLPVGLISPVNRAAASLLAVATFVRHIRAPHMNASLFPPIIPGTTITRPATWV